MKVIIIGAGVGGLRAAKVLADGGAEVLLFEAREEEELGFDWLDDVEPSVFEELSIPLPYGAYRAAPPTIIVPGSDRSLTVPISESRREWCIDSRALLKQLSDEAREAGASIRYGTPIGSLLFQPNKGDEVIGVHLNGFPLEADLVIDSSGALSPFRAEFPERCGISATVSDDDLYTAYRAVFTGTPSAGKQTPSGSSKRIYLKPEDKAAVVRCTTLPDGSVCATIGQVGAVSEPALKQLKTSLQSLEPALKNPVLRGDFVAKTPVRAPLTCMVADGYAAVGDAAFQTIPLLGKGIANSLRAGQFLAETVLQEKKTREAKETTSRVTSVDPVKKETLWAYQVKYYTSIGAAHFSFDLLRKLVLATDAKTLQFLLENDIATPEVVRAITTGSRESLEPRDFVPSLGKLARKPKFLFALRTAIRNGHTAEAIAKSIPKSFDEALVAEWQNKLEALLS